MCFTRFSLALSHTHTYVRAHTLSRTHARTHTSSPSLPLSLSLPPPLSHTHIRTHTLTCLDKNNIPVVQRRVRHSVVTKLPITFWRAPRERRRQAGAVRCFPATSAFKDINVRHHQGCERQHKTKLTTERENLEGTLVQCHRSHVVGGRKGRGIPSESSRFQRKTLREEIVIVFPLLFFCF